MELNLIVTTDKRATFCGILQEKISEASQKPINTFLHHFEQQNNIFSQEYCQDYVKMSIAMQNMTESAKQIS